jgi:hypothetical protein
MNAVVPAPVWYGNCEATPPARFVAVVAVVAEPAVVAVVAEVALPLSAAVIVPAEKLPDASRATTLLAVLAEVASTAAVTAAEPL